VIYILASKGYSTYGARILPVMLVLYSMLSGTVLYSTYASIVGWSLFITLVKLIIKLNFIQPMCSIVKCMDCNSIATLACKLVLTKYPLQCKVCIHIMYIDLPLTNYKHKVCSPLGLRPLDRLANTLGSMFPAILLCVASDYKTNSTLVNTMHSPH